MHWRGLGTSKQRGMISSRLIEIKSFQPLSLSALLVGLAAMNVQWHLLDLKLRGAVLQNLIATSQSAVGSSAAGMEQFVSNIVYSLGGMGATAAELSDHELSVLFHLIGNTDSFSEHGLSMVIYGLAKMKVVWRQIPLPAQVALAKNFLSISFEGHTGASNMQALSNSLWGLGQMEAVWVDVQGGEDSILFSTARTRIHLLLRAHATAMGDQGLSNSMLGLAKVGIFILQLFCRTTSMTSCFGDFFFATDEGAVE